MYPLFVTQTIGELVESVMNGYQKRGINAAIKTLEEGKMTDLKRREILFQQLSPFGDGFVGKLIAPFISEAIALERISDILPAGFLVGGRGGETSEV